MATLDIGKDFSTYPAGGYFFDGSGNAEEFREDYLMPRLRELQEGEKLVIILDSGVECYAGSFLQEAFARIVDYGYMQAEELKNKIEIKHNDPGHALFKNKIIQYIDEAEFRSAKYQSTRSMTLDEAEALFG